MTVTRTTELTSPRPLRLWPAVVVAVLLLLVRFVLPVVAPEAQFFGMGAQFVAILGGLAASLAIVLWWLFFSRAPWSERLAVVLLMIVAVVAMQPLTHISIQNGMMGRMFYVYAVPPTLSLALVAWAIASRRLSEGPRRAAMVAAILIGSGVWTLARTNGILGGIPDLEWRWTPTAEDRLLAQVHDEPAVAALPPAAALAPAVKEPVAPNAVDKAATPLEPAATAKTDDHTRYRCCDRTPATPAERAGIDASRMARLSRT